MKIRLYSTALLTAITQTVFATSHNTVYNEKTETDKDSISWNIHLDELIIMSPKERKDLSLTPVAASVMNTGMIKSKNFTGIKNISAVVPNLFMPDYGSRLTSPVYIRGVGSKINSPSVGLYIDDMPYFEKSAFDFNLNEIERIEVLRGPQGTLYGRNTMGGLIKVYTRSPLKYQGTSVRLGTGSYLTSNVGVSHYNKLTDALGVSLSANYNYSDGYNTNHFNNSKADKIHALDSRLRLEWMKSPKLHIGINSAIDYTDQNGYPYAPYDENTGKIGNVDYNSKGIYKRLVSTSGVSVSSKKEKFELNSQTSFQYLDDEQGIDQDFTPKAIYNANQYQKQHMVSEELNIKSRNDSWHKWLFGAFGFWQGIDNTVTLDYLSKNKKSEKFYDQSTYGIAFYHQSELNDILTKGLSLTLGLRYDLERTTMDYKGHMKNTENNDITSQFEPFSSKLKFGQLTPKISLMYEFSSTGIVYASVSKGYKTGGFNTSFETEEQRTFKPEYSWNYEIGAKHPFMDKRIMAEVALFYIDWKNQQISQPLPSGKGSLLTNAGHSVSKGVEVSLMWNIYKNLTFNTSYGFTDAKFKVYRKGDISYSGNYLPFVPNHTFNAGLNYSVASPFKGVDRVNMNLDFTGNGRIHWKEDNVASQPFYGLLNAKVGVSKGAFTVSAWARNITATQYTAFYFETGGKKLAQKGKPFMAGVDISINL